MNKFVKEEFDFLVKDIINHDEFIKTKSIIHHGLNRFDHSYRVSYYSYRIARMLGLSYEEVARAGLLHDFFLLKSSEIGIKDRAITLVNHPKYASLYSEKFFNLTEKEKDIISTHMFPVCPTRIPKYLESWLVDIVDDVVSIIEEFSVYKYQYNCLIIMIISILFFM